MHIHGPQNERQLPHVLRQAAQGANESKATTANQSEGGSAVGSQAPQHTAAPEVLQLAARLRQLPEVRTERVQQVVARLATGEYLSPEAAERTAAAIMES